MKVAYQLISKAYGNTNKIGFILTLLCKEHTKCVCHYFIIEIGLIFKEPQEENIFF